MKCAICEAPLTGGVDTFGDIHAPMCQWCFLELGEEPAEAPIFIFPDMENDLVSVLKKIWGIVEKVEEEASD